MLIEGKYNCWLEPVGNQSTPMSHTKNAFDSLSKIGINLKRSTRYFNRLKLYVPCNACKQCIQRVFTALDVSLMASYYTSLAKISILNSAKRSTISYNISTPRCVLFVGDVGIQHDDTTNMIPVAINSKMPMTQQSVIL